VTGRNYGVDTTGPARFNLTRLAPILEEVHERLSSVAIENLTWSAFIERYDRQETLFFLDPPITAVKMTMEKRYSLDRISHALLRGWIRSKAAS